MDEKDVAVNEECVEAELVHEGGSGPGPESASTQHARPPDYTGLFTRLKRFIAGALVVTGLALLIIGGLLTSTVIGAILGIPLMLAGGVLLVLFFKLFTGSLKSFVDVRKFP